MPNISWNEIRQRSLTFSRDWSAATREQADKQTFWNEFFNIFGISRRVVATFEEPVRRISGTTGFIDLFWPGKLLVEHKTAGHSLDTAESQAFAYIHDLISSGRQEEAPRYILLSDFQRFALYDLDPDRQENLPLFHGLRYDRIEFPLSELHRNIAAFAFIPGYTLHRFTEQDPINLKAVAIMTALHDTLKNGGYRGHDLERFLVRILFCLFAEDTGIFEPSSFQLYLENRTNRDGSDLGARIAELFEILDTPVEDRQRNLDESLAALPYVNGQLFAERLRFAAFNADMRNALLSCTRFDWSRISPAIFGALFQEVMTAPERRHIGAHYTSERDILKVIRPLFLDSLRAELSAAISDRSNRRRSRLDTLRDKLTTLKFLDPACGCGNFLVIAYRELRLLELDLLRQIYPQQGSLSLEEVYRLSQIDVDQFYGIEIEEWPARIAEVALWLMDHQMNMRIHEAFGQHFLRLPLRKTPHIHHANALRMDWNDALPATECSYILGNPPFVGKAFMNDQQKTDMKLVAQELGGIKGTGVLDYVAAWYFKAAAYAYASATPISFVSTNSITQGEQPAIVWAVLSDRFGLAIQFAYRTFTWESEARGKAHVHVVIIGITPRNTSTKVLYDRNTGDDQTHSSCSSITPYLLNGTSGALTKRSKPISKAPEIVWGSMPNDGGHLLLTPEEKEQLLAKRPEATRFVRPIVGAKEFLHSQKRWCLWLVGANPSTIAQIPEIVERIKRVREYRTDSDRKETKKLASTPSLFGEIRQTDRPYLLIPEASSELRRYIPMAMESSNVICSNLAKMVPDAGLFHFGILTSAIHMAWVGVVAGRLKSDYRYSNRLVYNNFPWPSNLTDARRTKIETLAQTVLDARALFPDSTLADLYDPILMPPKLLKAHQALDRAVDRLYRPEPFPDDQARVEFLFQLYERLTAPLLPATPTRRRSTRRT
ncbi:MAG TPA: DNA methyltransferase [Acidobacteriaceae bacterium]